MVSSSSLPESLHRAVTKGSYQPFVDLSISQKHRGVILVSPTSPFSFRAGRKWLQRRHVHRGYLVRSLKALEGFESKWEFTKLRVPHERTNLVFSNATVASIISGNLEEGRTI